MVRDLTLAEHLDEYLEVGSFEFLSQLADSKEFGSEAPSKPSAWTQHDQLFGSLTSGSCFEAISPIYCFGNHRAVGLR